MTHLPVFWSLFNIYVRQAFFHRKAALMTVFTWSLRTGLTIILYAAIYRVLDHRDVHGITYEVAISGMLLSAVFYGFATREVSFAINGENKSGMLEMWISKPLSYPGLKMVEIMGRGLPAALGLIVVVVIYWLCSDFPHVDHLGVRLACGLVMLVLGLMIALCVFAMSGLTSVFIQDARPVNSLIDRTISLFSGAFIPLGFYPGWFRLTGELLPMGATTYMSQIFYPDFFDHLPRLLLTQIIWVIICAFSLKRFNNLARQRLSVNGG